MSMTDAGREERQRILEMVREGAVSPEQGERLLVSLEQRSAGSQRCPYCAEEIPAQVGECPECRSPLVTGPAGSAARPAGSGFHGLGSLGKFLVCYTFMVCGLIWLLNPLGFAAGAVFAKMLAVLGVVGAVLICKGVRAGWVLSTIWAAVQIVPVVVNGILLNRQLLHVGINWTTNGSGLGFNAVGLVLLIMFIKAMPAADAAITGGR